MGGTRLDVIAENPKMKVRRVSPSPDTEENYYMQEDKEYNQQIDSESYVNTPSLRKSLTHKSITKKFLKVKGGHG